VGVRNVSDQEFEELLGELRELPELDLSLHAELPKLGSPARDRVATRSSRTIRRPPRGRSGSCLGRSTRRSRVPDWLAP
jgi:hypothetical protein